MNTNVSEFVPRATPSGLFLFPFPIEPLAPPVAQPSLLLNSKLNADVPEFHPRNYEPKKFNETTNETNQIGVTANKLNETIETIETIEAIETVEPIEPVKKPEEPIEPVEAIKSVADAVNSVVDVEPTTNAFYPLWKVDKAIIEAKPRIEVNEMANVKSPPVTLLSAIVANNSFPKNIGNPINLINSNRNVKADLGNKKLKSRPEDGKWSRPVNSNTTINNKNHNNSKPKVVKASPKYTIRNSVLNNSKESSRIENEESSVGESAEVSDKTSKVSKVPNYPADAVVSSQEDTISNTTNQLTDGLPTYAQMLGPIKDANSAVATNKPAALTPRSNKIKSNEISKSKLPPKSQAVVSEPATPLNDICVEKSEASLLKKLHAMDEKKDKVTIEKIIKLAEAPKWQTVRIKGRKKANIEDQELTNDIWSEIEDAEITGTAQKDTNSSKVADGAQLNANVILAKPTSIENKSPSQESSSDEALAKPRSPSPINSSINTNKSGKKKTKATKKNAKKSNKETAKTGQCFEVIEPDFDTESIKSVASTVVDEPPNVPVIADEIDLILGLDDAASASSPNTTTTTNISMNEFSLDIDPSIFIKNARLASPIVKPTPFSIISATLSKSDVLLPFSKTTPEKSSLRHSTVIHRTTNTGFTGLNKTTFSLLSKFDVVPQASVFPATENFQLKQEEEMVMRVMRQLSEQNKKSDEVERKSSDELDRADDAQQTNVEESARVEKVLGEAPLMLERVADPCETENDEIDPVTKQTIATIDCVSVTKPAALDSHTQNGNGEIAPQINGAAFIQSEPSNTSTNVLKTEASDLLKCLENTAELSKKLAWSSEHINTINDADIQANGNGAHLDHLKLVNDLKQLIESKQDNGSNLQFTNGHADHAIAEKGKTNGDHDATLDHKHSATYNGNGIHLNEQINSNHFLGVSSSSHLERDKNDGCNGTCTNGNYSKMCPNGEENNRKLACNGNNKTNAINNEFNYNDILLKHEISLSNANINCEIPELSVATKEIPTHNDEVSSNIISIYKNGCAEQDGFDKTIENNDYNYVEDVKDNIGDMVYELLNNKQDHKPIENHNNVVDFSVKNIFLDKSTVSSIGFDINTTVMSNNCDSDELTIEGCSSSEDETMEAETINRAVESPRTSEDSGILELHDRIETDFTTAVSIKKSATTTKTTLPIADDHRSAQVTLTPASQIFPITQAVSQWLNEAQKEKTPEPIFRLPTDESMVSKQIGDRILMECKKLADHSDGDDFHGNDDDEEEDVYFDKFVQETKIEQQQPKNSKGNPSAVSSRSNCETITNEWVAVTLNSDVDGEDDEDLLNFWDSNDTSNMYDRPTEPLSLKSDLASVDDEQQRELSSSGNVDEYRSVYGISIDYANLFADKDEFLSNNILNFQDTGLSNELGNNKNATSSPHTNKINSNNNIIDNNATPSLLKTSGTGTDINSKSTTDSCYKPPEICCMLM